MHYIYIPARVKRQSQAEAEKKSARLNRKGACLLADGNQTTVQQGNMDKYWPSFVLPKTRNQGTHQTVRVRSTPHTVAASRVPCADEQQFLGACPTTRRDAHMLCSGAVFFFSYLAATSLAPQYHFAYIYTHTRTLHTKTAARRVFTKCTTQNRMTPQSPRTEKQALRHLDNSSDTALGFDHTSAITAIASSPREQHSTETPPRT